MRDIPGEAILIEDPAALQVAHGTPRLRMSRPIGAILLPVGFALFVLVVWEVVVRWARVPEAILPPPSAIFDQIVRYHGLILKHAVPTTLETLLAFGLSIPLGVLLAALMTWSPIFNKAIYPNVVLFQLIPKIALAPLFIVWLGIG